jgi:hypothetical protein
MKLKLVFALLLVVGVTQAQDFEGTIKWSFKIDFTDPKMKAQVAEAQKQMSDPAVQAQLKQAMERMNTPEMKKMMETNPQLKAQMEAMMKNMQGNAGGSLIPTGFTLKTKNGNVLTQAEGGMLAGSETLYLKDKNESYLINRDAQTYTVIPQHETMAEERDPSITIQKTNETQKILNYVCTKTIVTITEDEHTLKQIFWTTKEIKNLDLKNLSNQKMGDQAMYYKNIDGVPLKMEMSMPQGMMTMQVTEIKKEALPASSFQIPSGFTQTPQ